MILSFDSQFGCPQILFFFSSNYMYFQIGQYVVLLHKLTVHVHVKMHIKFVLQKIVY